MILIVEPEIAFRSDLQSAISRRDSLATAAPSFEMMLDILEERSKRGMRLDAVVVDPTILGVAPERVFQELRGWLVRPLPPIVALMAPSSHPLDLVSLGAKVVLLKPVDPSVVAAAVNRAVKESEAPVVRLRAEVTE